MAKPRNPLRGFSTRQIQEGFDVSDRTARRWKQAGPPKSRAWDVQTFLGVHRAPRRKDVAKLLALPASDLAAIMGVSERTAQRWRAAKRIPERIATKRLTVISPTPEPARLRTTARHFDGRVTQGTNFETRIGAELSPTMIARLGVWASKLPLPVGKRVRYQLVAKCSSILAIDETMPERFYQRDRLELDSSGKTQSGDFVLASVKSSGRRTALRDFLNELRKAEEFPVHLETVTMIASTYL